ncbi:MAG: hypothetical protein RLP44_09050 [Aggregatilineales bacterium]
MTTVNPAESAQPHNTEPAPQPATLEQLQQAMEFMLDDLEANRQGKLSEMQNYHLRVRRQQAILTGASLIFLFIISATVLIFLGRRQESSILTIIGIGVTLGNAAMTGIFARYWLRINADIQRGKVHTITGTLERVVKPVTRRVVNMMIRVEGFETIVNKEVFESFNHKQPYKLYTTPYTGSLLSAEPLDDPQKTS